MASKTSKALFAEASKAQAAAKQAERTEFEKFGRTVARLLSPTVRGATDRIAAAQNELTVLLKSGDTVTVDSSDTVSAESDDLWEAHQPLREVGWEQQ